MAVAAQASVDRACPQCGSRDARAVAAYSTPEWHVVACAACGFVFLGNPPAYAALEEDFAWEKTKRQEADRRMSARPVAETIDRTTRWRLDVLRPKRQDFYRTIFPVGRVLDIGCAGEVTVPEPYVPYGIEISKALHAEVAPQMTARGGEALHGAATETIARFADGFFSGVILRSVLEHEKQPAELLAETARVMQPGGRAYVRVPNYGGVNRRVRGAAWCGFRHPDHVNYFTTESLGRMAREAGLTMRLLHPMRIALDDNINVVMSHAA